MESEEDATALVHLKSVLSFCSYFNYFVNRSELLRNRHFIGLLRSSTFEMFMNTPELLTIGQRVFDKCIADMQNNGQEIPDSDARLVKKLEEYLSGIQMYLEIKVSIGIYCVLLPLVDYMEEEEADVNTEHVGEEEVNKHAKFKLHFHCCHRCLKL